jgi:hypothetical protein
MSRRGKDVNEGKYHVEYEDHDGDDLQNVFDYFYELALSGPPAKYGAVDMRVVMKNVLDLLIASNGSENPLSLRDSSPRSDILSAIEGDMKKSSEEIPNLMNYLLDYPKLEKVSQAGRFGEIEAAALSYAKNMGIPTTRLLDNRYLPDLMKFLSSKRE